MADTKITRLRNLLTPFRNYFALLEEQENEPSLVMQDKMQIYLDTEKERIFKMQAEVWDIIAEIPNEACEGKNVDLKNANCAIFDVMASVSDELLLKAGKYEDEANADIETEGVQHNLNLGRYDGLMMAVQEINKHLP